MKTKVVILMLSLLLSCKTNKEEELEKNIQRRMDTIESTCKQMDSLVKKMSNTGSNVIETYKRFKNELHQDSVSAKKEYDPSEDETTCRQ